MKKRFCIWIGEKDRKHLEMISEVHDVESLSHVIRICIRATAIKLGLEKDIDEAIKK